MTAPNVLEERGLGKHTGGHTMGGHSAMKRDEALRQPKAMRRMSPENVMLRSRSQTQRPHPVCMLQKIFVVTVAQPCEYTKHIELYALHG